MTPKEKAKDLVDKFFKPIDVGDDQMLRIFRSAAKQCALIAVDEIISLKRHFLDYDNESAFRKYWQEVKTEIENL
jgi:hypothetical protein